MAKNYSSMTSKGQITIPFSIRNRLHLTTGHTLKFLLLNNSFVVVPINRPIKQLQGILPKPSKKLSVEEMNQVIENAYDRN